jgi:hypothetical protein
VRALQIVSSALYAPLPFANLDTRQIGWGLRQTIAARSARIEYVAKLLASDRPHFVRIGAIQQAAGEWVIRAEAYGENGEPFAEEKYNI